MNFSGRPDQLCSSPETGLWTQQKRQPCLSQVLSPGRGCKEQVFLLEQVPGRAAGGPLPNPSSKYQVFLNSHSSLPWKNSRGKETIFGTLLIV